MPVLKTGPLTQADLQKIWESAVDSGYREPLEAAGEGNGFEAWTQFFAQMARVSQAIDVTTQAMYIAPFSGQTNPPSSGAAFATVTLQISRNLLINTPLYLRAGTFVVGEQQTDAGDGGGVVVQTGRLYQLSQDCFFFPGEQGPFAATAVATEPGYGYDDPRPKSISSVQQAGAAFTNEIATVTRTTAAVGIAPPSSSSIVAQNEADMFIPDHVGQQVLLVTGANAGTIARMTGFVAPIPSANVGSAVSIELLWTAKGATHSGTFSPGEVLTFANGGPAVAHGKFVAQHVVGGVSYLAFVLVDGGSIAAATTVVGSTSGATMTIDLVLSKVNTAAEAPVGGVGGASWRVLSWAADFGVTTTNPASPSGGLAPMLDELGNDRGIYRASGEDDASFRPRVLQVADVVSPNAIKRTISRSFPFAWQLLETETDWPGIYFDGDRSLPSTTPGRARDDAYDTDVILCVGTLSGAFYFQEQCVLEDTTFRQWAAGFAGSPTAFAMTFIRREGIIPPGAGTFRVRGLHSGATFAIAGPNAAGCSIPATVAALQYHTWLDYDQMRAFFWVNLQPLGIGEFGMAYDVGASDAWDVGVYDGFPAGAAAYYLRVYQAVDRARAAGVGFELRLMT